MTICCCSCDRFVVSYSHSPKTIPSIGSSSSSSSCSLPLPTKRWWRGGRIAYAAPPGSYSKSVTPAAIRASMVDSYESSSDFVKRMEQAWLISQQPRPIACSSCKSSGNVECKWCRGTGFFILGGNMLCQVPSRNTTCVICSGKGSTGCSDCKGTGFRAKWLGEPPPSSSLISDQT